jgi:universal stress protein A
MTTTYQHILIATDLLPHCKNMVAKAKALAMKLGNHISLIHVIEPPLETQHIYVDQDEYHTKAIEEAMQKFKDVTNDSLPTAELHLKFGDIKPSILQFIKELNCDGLIVGNHDRHGIEKILGSTAKSLVDATPCDMFVVHYDKS